MISRARILWSLVFSGVASLVASLALPSASLGGTGVIYNSSVEWKTPSTYVVDSHQQYSPLWYYNGSTYFVWADAENRPWVTKNTNGTAQTVPLDPLVDYKAQVDGHNRFSMGIDKQGFIHIAGDMHNYTEGTTTPYLARYQKQSMLYWKSRLPASLDQGFAFAGGRGAATTLPGTGWSYGRFFADRNGELYYSARVKAIQGSHASGEMGVGLYRYDTTSKTWTARGGLADQIRTGTYHKVVLWEIGGVAPAGWYQGFIMRMRFDNQNRLHMAASINTDPTLAGNNRLVYAMSPDGGLTWRKANGSQIPGLPIRARDGTANLGDIVAVATQSPFFNSEVGNVADRDGRPGVVVDNVWRTWDGSKWTTANAHNNAGYMHGSDGYLAPDQHIIMPQNGFGKLTRTPSFAQLADGHDILDFKGYVAVSESSLRTNGTIYGVGIDSVGKTQSIVRTTITQAPLPCAWSNRDISATPLGYAGAAGFDKKRFVVSNYGLTLDGTNDSFHYTYAKLEGNGTIIARVASASVSGNARAGLMMRESLNPDAKHVTLGILPKDRATFVSTRKAVAGATTYSRLPLAGPYWLRLTRTGQDFRSFVSNDGISWSETTRVNLAMPDSIYVGLAAASYNKNYMQTVVFDEVSAPASNLTAGCHGRPTLRHSRIR